MWSDSYLALTNAQKTGDVYSGFPNDRVRWIHSQSAPPMLPPWHTGAAKSDLISMLKKGHNDVQLSREELDKIACWIDLGIPYSGDYTEANCWDESQKKMYNHFLAKRQRLEEEDRQVREKLAGISDSSVSAP